MPKVSLVGAGPGDPELITLKGMRALQNADAVLYDALVSDELLEYCPQSAVRLYVGKRAGRHSHSQDDINRLIVEHAFNCGHVVRLKGGDPFIFGRGQEELDYARSFGIETVVIPGISSAHAVPAASHIPLTARGISDSYWVVTGTTSGGRVSKDLYYAAQSNATVVILMGMTKLQQIMDVFASFEKAEVPAAVIQNGTLHNQRVAIGTVSTIASIARQQGLASPAIVVVGEVVKVSQHEEFMATVVARLTQKT